MKVKFNPKLQDVQIVVNAKIYCRKSFPRSKSSLEDTVRLELLITAIKMEWHSQLQWSRLFAELKKTKKAKLYRERAFV